MIEPRRQVEHHLGAGLFELKFLRIVVVRFFLIGNLAVAFDRDRDVGGRRAGKRLGVDNASRVAQRGLRREHKKTASFIARLLSRAMSVVAWQIATASASAASSDSIARPGR